MAQYTQRSQPMHRPGQTEHNHGSALAYGAGKGAVVAPQPRPPAAPYAPPYPPLRVHQPGYGSAALTYRDGSYSRTSGGVGEYRGGARMSLLGSYLPPPAPPALHPPPADPPPYKKIRYNSHHQQHHLHHHQQLRVDTREPVNAYNTVEVLSPNPPSEPTIEDQSFRTTKDDLLQQISKVDREMALSDAMLTKLKKKQEELMEQSATKTTRPEEPEEAPPRHRSLAQCVYADNRKKASAAHAVLSHLGPPVAYPLYNQPQDSEVYHENIRRHRTFRKRLAESIRRLKLEAQKREDALAEAYSRRASEWLRRVERIEQGQKRKVKDAKNREFFEKVFPELRKAREERERFNRLGARVKSEAELEEIADGLHEQEHEDKKMRSLTVVPPLLRDPTDRRPVYIDTNRRCMDMEAEHKELQQRNVWSAAERELFREKYLQHPKNFGQIASFLPRKSVRDCVRFYYLSKKAENYKQLLRKPRARRPARGPRAPPEPDLPPGAPTGVTTRQRAQGTARSENKDPSLPLEDAELGAPPDPVAIPVPPHNNNTPDSIRTPPLPPSPPPASSAPLAVPSAGTPPPDPLATDEVTEPISTVLTTAVSPSCLSPAPCWAGSGSAPPTPQPARPPTPTHPPPTPETAVTERTGTPLSAACAVCGAGGATRAVTRSRAAHYGLQEDSVGARVCEPCHCRCVRSRYTRCPVPTCPVARVRVKRLRHLPPRWHDLPADDKRPLMDEFQIPSDLGKCCLACFKRITRRLDTLSEGAATEPTEDEVTRFRALVREHGTAWEPMAKACGRSAATLKAFYFTYRKQFQFDTLLADRLPAKGSGTDTESSLVSGDSDTASAGSGASPGPPPPLRGPRTDAVAPKGRRRDEYDSSATETADEENDAPTAKIIPSITLSTPVSSTGTSTSVTSVTSVSGTSVRNGPGTPLTVRDVVLNMIEISLLKNNQPTPPTSKPQPPKVTSSGRESLATLSVVSSSHVTSSPLSPHRPATITPLPDKEVMVVIEPRLERQEPLLDLSVKKRCEIQAKPVSQLYRNSTEYSTYRTQPERESPTQYNSKIKPISTPRPTLKPVPNSKGSITLGTPVENRFDARRTPPDPKTGSITAGTPVHGSHHLQDKKNVDYYKRRSPGGPGYYPGVANQPRPQSPNFQPNSGYSRPYALDNRQIIMTDFITSQQMHGAARRGAASPQYSPRRDPPSVITRHTPYTHPHPHPHPPPGHEAFTSLVEVANAATALPVPRDHKDKHNHHHASHNQEIRLQDRMRQDIHREREREMAIAQKFHQQQLHYQVLERDRRGAQAQYERQIAMHQNRERDRVMVAALVQEQLLSREHHQQQHPQHPPHPPHMMHERHHIQHTQQQNVPPREEPRLPAGAPPKHRAITPLHQERKDTRPPAPPARPGAPDGTGTLTAASLIDAIITHQINQTSDQRFPAQQQAPGLREDPPPPERPPDIREREEALAAHTTSMKLGDLASNIITRDFSSPTTSMLHHNSNRFAGSAEYAGEEWKRRGDKHAPYLEPVSPPDNHHQNRNNNNNRRYAAPTSTPSVTSVGGPVMTAFEYVTTRIVEVMRDEERAAPAKPVFPPVPANQYYPYSALNVAATVASDGTAPTSTAGVPPAPALPPAPEPAPLMSAQYEPLSDED